MLEDTFWVSIQLLAIFGSKVQILGSKTPVQPERVHLVCDD